MKPIKTQFLCSSRRLGWLYKNEILYWREYV